MMAGPTRYKNGVLIRSLKDGERTKSGPGAEGLDLAVALAADAGDLVLAHMDPELGDQVVDLPRRDPVQIGLHDDPEQSLLRALARLQEAQEAALPGALATLSRRKLECSSIRALVTTPVIVIPWLSAIVVLLRRLGWSSTDESGAPTGSLHQF
jgi:hypothetical protein